MRGDGRMDDTMKDVVLESKLNSSRRPSLDTLNEPSLDTLNEPTLLQREVVFEKPLRQ